MSYALPNPNILSKSDDFDIYDQAEEIAQKADIIVDTLDQLGARCEIDHDLTVIAPQVIRYSAIAAEKVAVRKIPALAPELQYAIGAESVVINAPAPGTKYITIEIPAPNRRLVSLGDVIDSASSPLTFSLGTDTSNNILSVDIKQAPHFLIAGQTGAGKSNMLNSMICSLLMKTTPDELLFMNVDTKLVELPIYDGIPNLMCPCVTDAYEAINVLQALVQLMEDRYQITQQYKVKNLDELNSKLSPAQKVPYILVVIDEVADLIMLSKHEVEESIVRIAQKARAVGIHLIVSTQSPRREIITGLLKANLPSRLAFSTSSELDSRIIIDKNGAGALLGMGDCLYSQQGKTPQRVQTPYISGEEIESVINHCKQQNNTEELIAA